MIFLRKSGERGYFNHGWLETWHSFSFGEYYDPRFMGFRSLRVINEDRVQPAEGFPTHGHQNMEILTYILDGSLEHRDSAGGGGIIRPGDVQYMSAGSGVRHSEFNASETEVVHLLQIWILPQQSGGAPVYAERHFSKEKRQNRLCPIASGEGREDSLRIRQDAVVHAALLDGGRELELPCHSERHVWLQLARGRLEVKGLSSTRVSLSSGDGLAIPATKLQRDPLTIRAEEDSEFLVFDLS